MAALMAGGCTIDVDPLVPLDRPSSIRVVVPESDRGTADARRPFSLDVAPVTVDLEVLGPDGARASSFEGYVELRIEPGDVVSIEPPGGEMVIGPFVPIHGGVATGVVVGVARVYSDARLWAEEIGFTPADPTTASCANGLDDDDDGFADFPSDPGCRYANDDTEIEGSHAIGVSDILYFANPRLGDVQGYTGMSPLNGRLVRVDQGVMVATRVTTDGFYVSEIEVDGAGVPTGRAVPWSAMFVFNFNTPPFLRACDQILMVSGSVGEFFGFTELNQPSWARERWCSFEEEMVRPCVTMAGVPIAARNCPIPEPFVLDGAVLGTPDMEAYESGLVRITNAVVPTRFGPEMPPVGSNCDLNGDGDVNLTTGNPEDTCNDACSMEPGCSEWNQFLEFGQYAVQAAGTTLNVVSRDSAPDFDPVAHRGETLPAITGTLRHFAPLGPQRGYILEPRCDEDLTLPGEMPMPSTTACVTPRTGGEIEPD